MRLRMSRLFRFNVLPYQSPKRIDLLSSVIYQAHGVRTRFGDLPEMPVAAVQFCLSLLPIFLSLLCGLICLLLLAGGLLAAQVAPAPPSSIDPASPSRAV